MMRGISYAWRRVADEMPPKDRVLIIASESGIGEMGYWDGNIWRNNDSASLQITPAWWKRYMPPKMSKREAQKLMKGRA